MPLPLDPQDAKIFRMKMRAAALERHARARDPETGKSLLAVRAGKSGGRVTSEKHASSSAWGLRMSMARWHGVPLSKKEPSLAGDGREGERRDCSTTRST